MRAQAYIRDEVERYQPSAEEMDYPAKLERAAAAAAAAAAEANGSSGYGTSEDEGSHGDGRPQPGANGDGVNGSQRRSASSAVRPSH